MHAGLPIISTKQPEFEYIINKYSVGKTFDYMNSKSFKHNLLSLINNIKEYKKNTLLVKEENNWNTEKYKLINIYKRMLLNKS